MIKFPLSVVIGAVDKWTGPLSKMQTKINTTFAPLRELNSKVHALGEASGVRKLTSAFQGVGDSVGHAIGKVAKFGAVLAGLSAAGGGSAYSLYHMAEATAELGLEAHLMSQKLGISTQTLQELGFAAKLAHMDQSDLQGALGMLSKKLGMAALGSSSAAEGFNKLRIRIFDANHEVRPLIDVFEEAADKLNELRDEGKRNAISSLLFSRGWAKVAPLMRGGSAGIQSAALEARKFNLVMSDEAVHASVEFMHAQTRMKGALIGTRNIIGGAFIPALTHLIEKVEHFVLGHREEIAQWASRFADGFPHRLEQLAHFLEQTFKAVTKLVKGMGWLLDTFGAMPTAITSVGTLFVAVMTPSILSVVASLYTLNAAIVATPIGWIILAVTFWTAAVASLVFIVYTLIDRWDTVVAKVKSGLASVGGWFTKTGRLIKSNLNDIAVFWNDLWDQLVGKFDRAWDFIAGKVKAVRSLFSGLTSGNQASVAANAAAPERRISNFPQRVAQASAAAAAATRSQASLKVEFANAPKGLRVSEVTNTATDVDLKLGYAMLSGN